jgi:hypothetical protein
LINAEQLIFSSTDSTQAKHDYDHLDHTIIYKKIQAKEIKRIWTQYVTTHRQWSAINEEASRIEEALGIETCWMPDSKEYKEAVVLLNQRKYRRALDNLERLVVQRLFELMKLGMSGVGKSLMHKSFFN